MNARRISRHLLHLSGTLGLIVVCLIGAYFFTGFVFGRLLRRPPDLVVQIINTLLGLGLMVATIAALTFRTPNQAFGRIIEALERIAKGDFSTRVTDPEARGSVGALAQTVNQMAVQLDQIEKMRQEFISNVSHEIQSPLTSIRGFACALRENHLDDEERRHYLEIIEAEGTRLSKLAANLLKLAALDSDQARFEPKPYRLDAQIRSLVLASEPQWAAKQIEMEVSLDEATIAADEDLLSQIWINLIHNSIKFTPEGGRVRVTLQGRDDRFEVRITDTGIGIAPEDQPHIFERFYKADKSRNRGEGGSGLGLAIVKKTVEMHGGTIAVESQTGAGSTFFVKIPATAGREFKLG